MTSSPVQPLVLAGAHCTFIVSRPAPRALLVQISGMDVGELDRRPFEALDNLLRTDTPIELFIDARDARGPSVDVSAQWANWLRANRDLFAHVNMLTRSPFVQLTADFVQRFSELGERMRIFADPVAFDTVLKLAILG